MLHRTYFRRVVDIGYVSGFSYVKQNSTLFASVGGGGDKLLDFELEINLFMI